MWEIMQKGGPLMWPILFCSILAFGLIVERIFFLHRSRIDTRSFMEQIAKLLRRNRIIEAVELCEKTKGPVAQLIKTGVLKHDRPRSEIREAIEDAALYEVPRLEKNMGIIATIVKIAPLLGFLGTITGMIEAFQVIERKATSLNPVNPGDLAGGIWEALLTTVAGLCVAIPTLVAYNYLSNRIHQFVLEIERSATDLVEVLSEKRDVTEV